MKIRFLSGPRKGQVSDAPRSQETKLLLDAGIIERWFEPIQPAVVTWGIGHTAITEQVYLSATCSRNCARMFFDGPAALAEKKAVFYHGCGGAMPEHCPKHVIEAYAKEKSEAVPRLTADEIEMHTAVARFGRDSNKPMEIQIGTDEAGNPIRDIFPGRTR